MLRTQIQIEEDQIRWLRDRAKERGVSVSQLIREGVEFYRKYEDQLSEDKKRKHWRPWSVMHQEFPTYLKSTIRDELEFNNRTEFSSTQPDMPQFVIEEALTPNRTVFDVPRDEISKIWDRLER